MLEHLLTAKADFLAFSTYHPSEHCIFYTYENDKVPEYGFALMGERLPINDEMSNIRIVHIAKDGELIV